MRLQKNDGKRHDGKMRRSNRDHFRFVRPDCMSLEAMERSAQRSRSRPSTRRMTGSPGRSVDSACLTIIGANETDISTICTMSWTASEFDRARGYPPQWITPGDESIGAAIVGGYMRKVIFEGQIVGCFSIHEADELLWGPSESAWYLHLGECPSKKQQTGNGDAFLDDTPKTHQQCVQARRWPGWEIPSKQL